MNEKFTYINYTINNDKYTRNKNEKKMLVAAKKFTSAYNPMKTELAKKLI